MQKKIPIFENKNMQVPIDSSLQRFINTTLYFYLFSHLVQYSFTQLSPEPDLPRWVLLQQHRRHSGLEKVPDVPGLEKKQLHFIFVRTNNTKYLPKSLLHDIDFFISHRIWTTLRASASSTWAQGTKDSFHLKSSTRFRFLVEDPPSSSNVSSDQEIPERIWNW